MSKKVPKLPLKFDQNQNLLPSGLGENREGHKVEQFVKFTHISKAF